MTGMVQKLEFMNERLKTYTLEKLEVLKQGLNSDKSLQD